MSTVTEIYTIASVVIVGVGIGVVGKRWGWFELVSGTNKLLREQNQELRNQNEYLKDEVAQMVEKNEKDRRDWAEKHEENIKQLAQMQGQIDVLKSIPLVNIDVTLKTIAEFNKNLARSNEKIVTTNNKILESLQATAKIAAEDRDVLTNQNVHIATEVKKAILKDKKGKK